MTEAEALRWFLVHFGAAALVVLVVTAIVEHYTGEDV